MIDLRMRSAISEEELESKVGAVLTPDDFNVLLTRAATVRKPDGSLLCIYLPRAVSVEEARASYPVLHMLQSQRTSNRGLAAGSGREVRGEQKWTVANPVPSACIGAMDPGGKQKRCRLTTWTWEHLAEMRQLDGLLSRVAGLYAAHVPDRYRAQMAQAVLTHPEWRLGDTPFTTLTVNNSFPTGVHVDKGDLDEGFSAITVLRRGDYEGCELVFPKYRLAVDLGHRDLILMDAHEWHGNTAFRRRSQETERISTVYYYRTKMIHCGTAEEEERKAHDIAARRSGFSVAS